MVADPRSPDIPLLVEFTACCGQSSAPIGRVPDDHDKLLLPLGFMGNSDENGGLGNTQLMCPQPLSVGSLPPIFQTSFNRNESFKVITFCVSKLLLFLLLNSKSENMGEQSKVELVNQIKLILVLNKL